MSPSPTPARRRAPGLLGTALTVARKEVAEALRDRQTVIYTVLVPLALYPVLGWLALQVFLVVQAQDARTQVTLGVVGAPADLPAERVEAWLAGARPGEAVGAEPASTDEAAEGDAPSVDTVERLPAGTDRAALEALLLGRDGAEPAEDAPDAVVVFSAEGGAEVVHVSTRSRSRLAADRAGERLQALGGALREEGLRSAGRDPERIAPFELETVDLSGEADRGGMVLSFLLPMMFVIMTVLGAFFPAVDLTAGEKERRTAETTLLVPAPRAGVQLGKVLTVTLAALVATTVNFVGMSVALEGLLAGLGDEAPTIRIPWLSLASALPLGLVFLLGTSAVMVALGSFADTFKQGQALLNSVMLVFIFPAMFAVMPGVELTPALAAVPVVQTVLGLKALIAPEGLDGRALAFGLVVVLQLVYAALALVVALRVTTREALATGGAAPSRLRQVLRSGGTPR